MVEAAVRLMLWLLYLLRRDSRDHWIVGLWTSEPVWTWW